MNKIFNSLLIIVVAIVVIGTAACFMGDKIGITFSDAELVLKIRDQDEGYKEGGVVGTWKAENMLPGDGWAFDAPFVGLFNARDISSNHLEITCDYTVTEEDPCLESDTDWNTNLDPDKMAKEMIIMKSIYHGIENGASFCIDTLSGERFSSFDPVKRKCIGIFPSENPDWKINDQPDENGNYDGKISFFDLKNDKLDNLPPPNAEVFYVMNVMFANDAGNDFQGDAFDLTMFFTSNEDASQ